MSILFRFSQIFLAISLAQSHVIKPKLTDYCRFTRLNVPCTTSCRRSKSCGNNIPYKSLTLEERELVVHKHNIMRQDVALGTFLYPPGNAYERTLPPAEDMNVLSYDLEAEFLAGCQAKQCSLRAAKPSVSHRGRRMNQELFTITHLQENDTFQHEFLEYAIEHFVQDFAVQPFNITDVLMDYRGRFGLRTLTQLFWSETKFVGCAKMRCTRMPGTFTTELYCNYFPAGNIEERAVYTIGSSMCDEVKEYDFLCGSIRPIEEDPFVPPINLDTANPNRPPANHLLTVLVILVYILNS